MNSSHQYSAVYGSLNKAHQRKSRVIQKERGRERGTGELEEWRKENEKGREIYIENKSEEWREEERKIDGKRKSGRGRERKGE